ncbi:helix-turn-helix domain-containing protein [Luteolibacter algae]|uniref:Helix-turn-helix domain-containing protein n=1 Tax=Luteolibacter algae TaxID=454151 RepID=A0ABW5D279_9BACT
MPDTDDNLDLSWSLLAPGLITGGFRTRINNAGLRWQFPSKGQIWLWMNHGGNGLIWGSKDRFILKPGMYALTGGGDPSDWMCLRYPGEHHLDIVKIDPTWLASRLGRALLHPEMKKWLSAGCPVAFCGLMGVWENELGHALGRIASSPAPGKLIAEAKILEWAAVRLFRTSPTDQVPSFCASIRDKNPVRRALDHLASHLDEPLDLPALARHSGIAPHYLSRKVRAETGSTLQRHLRRLRIERACELLASGKSNITESSLEVGYQSLSHFAKAFREEVGTSPREWLASQKKTA